MPSYLIQRVHKGILMVLGGGSLTLYAVLQTLKRPLSKGVLKSGLVKAFTLVVQTIEMIRSLNVMIQMDYESLVVRG